MDPREGHSLDLRGYLSVLRRRWLVVALGTVLGLASGCAFLLLRPPQVTATVLVNVTAISSELFNTARSESEIIDPQTEEQLARSSQVVAAVSESLHNGTSPGEVREAVTAELLPDGTVLSIQYIDSSSARAAEGADAVASEYLAYRSQLAQSRVETVAGQLSRRRVDLGALLVKANKRLSSAAPGSSKEAQATSERQQLSLELDSLFSQLIAVTAIDTTSGTILTSAADTTPTVSPRPSLVLVSGTLAGLLLGLVAAFAVNALDRRIRDPYDVEEAGAGPALLRVTSRSATIPALGEDLDAIRTLRERLLATLPEGRLLLTVGDLTTSSVQSDIGPNLAVALAGTGATVQIVLPGCARDFERYLVHALELRKSDDLGASGLYRSVSHPGLSVNVATGTTRSDDPSGFLSGFKAGGNREVDVTIVALPPDASSALRIGVGRLSRSCLLVAAELGTRTTQLANIAAELRAVGCVIHGTVVVSKRRRLDVAKPRSHDAAAGRQNPAETVAQS